MQLIIKKIFKLIKEYGFELKSGILSLTTLTLVDFLILRIAVSKGAIISNKNCLVLCLVTFTGWLVALIFEVTILHQRDSLDQKL